MIINDFHIVDIAIKPYEANAPLRNVKCYVRDS